jgi:para-nitrobenzyl esterase
MISYWANFVINGTPKAAGLPNWSAQTVGAESDVWMSLRPGGSTAITHFETAHQCPFWASLNRRS